MSATKRNVVNPINMRTTQTEIQLVGSSNEILDFTDAITAIAWTPATTGASISAVNSVTHSSATAATWTADITLAQDDSQDSFLDFLNDNEGLKAKLQTRFNVGGQIREAEITLVAVAIGGAADGRIKTSNVSMPSSKPVIVSQMMSGAGE